MTFTVTLPSALLTLDRTLEAEVRRLARDPIQDLRSELEKESPRGVSAGGEALSQGWQYQEGRGDVLGTVRNDVDRAYNRIVGRGPGKATPWDEGTSLNDWVRGKLGISDPKQRRGIAYTIARRHAREGSRRYVEGRNILDIDPQSGKYRPGSPIFATGRQIEQAVSRVRIII